MKEKIKIQIPVVGLSKSQAKQQLEQICSEYEDEFIFEASPDEEYHIEKINSKEDIFAIMVNVEGMTRQQAEHYVYDLLVKYKNYNNMLEYKFIFLPTNNEKNQVIKLTNTDKEVELLF